MGHQIQVTPKPIKSVRLKVDMTTGKISISCPYHLSEKDIRGFLVSKQDWLNTQLAKPTLQRPKMTLQHGEMVFIWGKEKELLLQRAAKKKIEIDHHAIIISSPENLDIEAKHRLLKDLYRSQLKLESDRLLSIWQPKITVPVSFLGIKNMKTKWGSCNIHKARIWLNLNLAKYPVECTEMVLVHELVHLLEPSHNSRFYRLMSEFLPGWETADQMLNQM